MARELSEAFSRADFPEVLRKLDDHFGGAPYSIKSLFKDQQRKALRMIMETAMAEGEAYARQFYEANAPTMRYLIGIRAPLPKAFKATAELIVNLDLDRVFDSEIVDVDQCRQLLKEAEIFDLELNKPILGYELGLAIERTTARFAADPGSLAKLKHLLALVEFAGQSPFPVNYWRVQNLFWDLSRGHYPSVLAKAKEHDSSAHAYVDDFLALAEMLKVRVNGVA
jgi:hypothetical protein